MLVEPGSGKADKAPLSAPPGQAGPVYDGTSTGKNTDKVKTRHLLMQHFYWRLFCIWKALQAQPAPPHTRSAVNCSLTILDSLSLLALTQLMIH